MTSADDAFPGDYPRGEASRMIVEAFGSRAYALRRWDGSGWYPISVALEIVAFCEQHGLGISGLMGYAQSSAWFAPSVPAEGVMHDELAAYTSPRTSQAEWGRWVAESASFARSSLDKWQSRRDLMVEIEAETWAEHDRRFSFELIEPRALTPEERRVLERVLEATGPAAQQLADHLDAIQVNGTCRCGCVSVQLVALNEVQMLPWPSLGARLDVVDEGGRKVGGVYLTTALWAYRDDENPVTEWPPDQRIRVRRDASSGQQSD